MEHYERSDKLDAKQQEMQERLDMERRLKEAANAKPPGDVPSGEPVPLGDPSDNGDPPDDDLPGQKDRTFRYSDQELHGEIHTMPGEESGAYSSVRAELHRHGERENIVGSARYRIEGKDAIIYADTVIAANYGVESVLLNEVSQQARNQGADRMCVWAPDNSAGNGMRWASHGFQPTQRDPGAAGVYWQRPLV